LTAITTENSSRTAHAHSSPGHLSGVPPGGNFRMIWPVRIRILPARGSILNLVECNDTSSRSAANRNRNLIQARQDERAWEPQIPRGVPFPRAFAANTIILFLPPTRSTRKTAQCFTHLILRSSAQSLKRYGFCPSWS
jgi:hypothetical protein